MVEKKSSLNRETQHQTANHNQRKRKLQSFRFSDDEASAKEYVLKTVTFKWVLARQAGIMLNPCRITILNDLRKKHFS